MKLPLSWIYEWIDPGLSPDELSERLTMAGIEVDHLGKAPLPFEGVVVGEVVDVKPHPEAERLVVATVSDGGETFQVVCGASNCRKGLKTPFAKVGARLTDAEGHVRKIKKGKLRGIESFGMLCAEEELQLGQSEGIAELPKDAKVGQDFGESVGDWILEVSLTPNLGHCSSVLGIARELAAITEKPLKGPTFSLKEKGKAISTGLTVEDKEGCPKYCARVIREVKVAPSPAWLALRLERSGIRSINNVVDVTNFVMLELGQPMHAFDLSKVEGDQIVVRRAKEGETLTTLDGEERKLSSEILAICDGRKALAVAGVMGGAASEVSEEATDLLLEAAYFDPNRVRAASRALGLATESHRRFERGVDPNGVNKALDRAATLICEVAGGTVAKGALDSHPKSFPLRGLTLRASRANALLGLTLSVGEIEALLKRLEFTTKVKGDALEVVVPSYRSDVKDEIDLVEEVARLYGYENIGCPAPTYHTSDLPDDPAYLFESRVRALCLGQGLQELVTTTLISPKEAAFKQSEGQDPIPLIHPSSVEQSVLRPSLLPSLLQVARHNQHTRLFDLTGFEVGRVHFKTEDQFQEGEVLGLILAGNTPHHPEEKGRVVDFFDLKGIVENLIEGLSIPETTFKRSHRVSLHPGRQAELLQGNQVVGTLGEVHPSVLRAAEVEGRIYFAELNLHALCASQPEEMRASPLPTQPSSERDWTIALNEEDAVGELLSKIRAVPSRLLQEVKLLDIYRSEKIGKGKKSVTVRMVYRDDRKTVSANQVEADHARIIKEVEA